MFVTAKTIRTAHVDVSSRTLRRWAGDGRVRSRRSTTGRWRYALSDVLTLAGVSASGESTTPSSKEAETGRGRVLYARVSSVHQRGDLARQSDALRTAFPAHEALVEDVGSGLNFRRRGFRALLERVRAGSIREVVVAHRDRLCRFGFDFVEDVFRAAGARVVVHNTGDASPESELADDLLAVATVFVARQNGLRSGRNRRTRKRRREAGKDDSTSHESHTARSSRACHPRLPDREAGKDAASVVRHHAGDVQLVR